MGVFEILTARVNGSGSSKDLWGSSRDFAGMAHDAATVRGVDARLRGMACRRTHPRSIKLAE